MSKESTGHFIANQKPSSSTSDRTCKHTRRLALASTPQETGKLPWQQSSAQYQRYEFWPAWQRMQVGLEPSTSGQGNEGMFARMMDWLAGTGSQQNESKNTSARTPAEMQGFLQQTEGPDRRLAQSRAQRPAFASEEEEWRHDCLAFADVKNLQHVEEMRAFYFDPGSIGREDDADVTVVGVGAHYKRNVATQEELLLHIVKEMEKVGPSRQYTIVYFNADAELGAIPDTIFFQQLHAALHPSHKRNLKAFYVVHPTRLLKYWIFMLRLGMPEIYGRVTYVDRLAELHNYLGPEGLEIPQHVDDHDKSLA